jgi:SAM-dependent methyltransferase
VTGQETMAGSRTGDPVDIYTHGHHDSVLRSHRWRTAANSAAYLLPYLRPGMTLLDVGCGPGTLTADLASVVAPGAVLGIDLSSEVIEEARRNVAASGNVTWMASDFRHAELPQRPFDVVHAHQVLQHLRDPVGALVAMRQLTRPGGIVAARDADYPAFVWTAPGSPSSRSALDRWRDIYVAVTRRNGADASGGRRLLEWAHRAGLDDVKYSSSNWTFATPEERRWWADLWAERTVASAFAEQASRYGLSSPEELASIADGWRTWSQDADAIFIVVHGEIVARVTGDP